MKIIKSTIIIIISLVTSQAFSQYTDVINSNRPGVSRSAYSVGTKVLQFEVGPYLTEEKRTPFPQYEISGYGVDFAARYGLLTEQLEINVEGTYQKDTKTYTSNFITEVERSNIKYFTVGAKYLIFDPHKNIHKEKPNLYSWKANHRFRWRSLLPAVSLYLGGNFDTKDNSFTAAGVEGFSPKVMLATQHNFAGGWVFIMNFIMDRIGSPQSDFQYILTLTHSFNPKWVIFGEMQGIKSDFYADNIYRVGTAYLLGDNFQLDTGLTFNAKDTPAVLGVSLGASYRLDFHKDKANKYKPPIKNGASAKEERKRKKNADKTNEYQKQKKEKIEF